MAGRDPNDERWPGDGYGDSVTYLEAFTNAWNEAIDADPADRPRATDDPWGSAPPSTQGGYSDEPPF
jgi:hypothetical protein